ncbi:MAG: DegQ family serine endoprotease [Thermodesulfobacteriota bacterium]
MFQRITIVTSILAAALMLSVVMSSASFAASGALQQLGDSFAEVAQKVTPAVVHISSTVKVAGGEGLPQLFEDSPLREFFGEDFFRRFGPRPQEPGHKMQGMGSGFIVSQDGKVVTNYHVVKDADEVTVTLADKRTFKAKVIGSDKESDIAVLQIKADNLPTAQFGDSDKLRVGDIVLAIGNPFGLSGTVTSGIVSAKGRSNVGILDYEDFIQTDAAINPGNSGGPLVNMHGEVVGINTAIASKSGGYQGIGFAIPSNSARLVEEQIVKQGKVHRGLLGVNVQTLNEALAKSFGVSNTNGALVSQVVEGSPAAKAGVKSGDVILEFNGKSVQDASHLRNMVASVRPGTKCSLTVLRGKDTQKLMVTVEEKGSPKVASASTSNDSESSAELGIGVEEVPATLAQKLHIRDKHGVRVTRVNPDGVGGKMGLHPGDVILQVDAHEISGIPDFKAAVAKAKDDKVIRFKIQRGNQPLFLGYSLG